MRSLALPIDTDRLRLRPFTPDDVEDMYAYQGLATVARYLYRLPRTLLGCAEIIASMREPPQWDQDGDSLTLAVCRRGETRVLGEVSLTLASARAQQVEIGWTFNPRHGNQGFATEAARALAASAFDDLGAHRVFARLDVENSASVRLCERLGMRREAQLVDNDLDPEGRWGSEYVYAALAGDLRR
jgi:RimJ/RimL family protein N-acetyltransferase